MRWMALPIAVCAALLPSAAQAEKLVTGLSTDEVSISSSFDGEALTLFGNIEPSTGASEQFVTGPYHVIVVVVGPLDNRVVRLKRQQAGIWMNTEQVVFQGFPSYYQVLASDRLTDIMTPALLNELGIEPQRQAQLAARSGTSDALRFAGELVRLMNENGHVGVNEQGVAFRSDTFYSAQIKLPSDVPNGAYVAHTYLFKSGELLAEHSDGFSVRTAGFERFLSVAATQYPLPYGLVCVALALFTGWLGGVIFKR